MLNIKNRIYIATALIALIIATYIGSYGIIKNKVIKPYERANIQKIHAWRPAYNFIYYPLRRYEIQPSLRRAKPYYYSFGYLQKDSSKFDDTSEHRTITLKHGNIKHPSEIQFFGSKRALSEFDTINNGDFLSLTFKLALSSRRDKLSKKLILSEVIALPSFFPHSLTDYPSKETYASIYQSFEALSGHEQECAEAFVSYTLFEYAIDCVRSKAHKNSNICTHGPNFTNPQFREAAINRCTQLKKPR